MTAVQTIGFAAALADLSNPAATTAGNILRAVPITLALSLFALPWLKLDAQGVLYAAR